MASTSDSTLYLYTSLTAGSSHIITATSRLETILKANKIPFRAVDCATDEKARMLWGRRSKGRKLPGLVKFGNVIADIEQVEEWNEFGELTEQIEAADFAGVNPDAGRTPHPSAALPLDIKPPDSSSSEPVSRASSQGRLISISEPTTKAKPSQSSSTGGLNPKSPTSPSEPTVSLTLRQLGAEAAAKAAQRKPPTATRPKAAEPVESESAAAKTTTKVAAEEPTKASTEKAEKAEKAEQAEKGDAQEPKASVSNAKDTPAASESSTSGKSSKEQVADPESSSTQTKQPEQPSEPTAAATAAKEETKTTTAAVDTPEVAPEEQTCKSSDTTDS